VPARPGAAAATIGITASATFVPGDGDGRELGVMVDRWQCAPAAPGFVRPPPATVFAAAAGGAAFGAAFVWLGASLALATAGALAVAVAQATPLAWEFGMFTPYAARAAWLGLVIGLMLPAGVRATEWLVGRRMSGAARLASACTAVALYLKLLALLHPSKLIIDAVFHAHRLQWVLDGRFYFTQPMPSGVQFPYAIGLYVFSAPFSLLTSDFVMLLRIVVASAEALTAALIYLMVARVWQDRWAAVGAVALYHLVPRTFNILGNANMTNAFAQSVALVALSAAVLWPLGRGRWKQATGLTLLIACALLSHISTFTLLGGILMILAALYGIVGGRDLRRPALTVLVASATAVLLSIGVYYAHFGDAYRSALRVRATPSAAGSQGGDATPSSVQPPSLPLQSKIAEAGRLTVAAVGWPIFLLAALGLAGYWRRWRANRLDLAVMALLLTLLLFVVSVVAFPVERSFQRYASEFISRVTLATYPALVILAGAAAAGGLRGGWPRRLVTGGLLAAALFVGYRSWMEWLA
jgi:hypothetical protein